MALRHANAGDVVDMRPLGSSLRESKTAAIVKRDRFEAVRLVVPAGTTIPVHQVKGYITVQCLEGAVALVTTHDIELRAGDWVYLDRNTPHAVRGIEDSSLLLTIFFDD